MGARMRATSRTTILAVLPLAYLYTQLCGCCTYHTTYTGAQLDPTHPSAPFAAVVVDEEGMPVTERDGPQDDPYGIGEGGTDDCDGGVDSAATPALDDLLLGGDGTLVAAEQALERICGDQEEAHGWRSLIVGSGTSPK